MGLYTLRFDLAGVFTGTLPKLVVKYGGYKIGMAYASEDGTSVSLVIDTGDKAFVSSDLIFGFVKDGVSDPSRQILVSNIRIDGEAVNTSGFSAQYGNPDITTDHLALGTGDTATSNVHGHIPETPAEYTPPAPDGSAPAPATFATITGDAGNNKLWGTDNADTINGLDGNDKIYGKLGDDVISGGNGTDYIDGGDGADTINGDAGNDVIYAGLGNDTVHGGLDDDRLFGQDGDDYIYGDDGNDYVHGGAGADHIYGGIGADKLAGDIGNDVIYGGDGNDQLFGDEGDDELHGEAGDDRMIGNDGNDTMYGDDGNDNMDGQYGNDIMYGGIGIDTVDGEQGDDTIDGGDGNDYLIGGLGSDVIDGGTGDDIIHGGGIASWDQYDIRVNSSWGASGLLFNEQTQTFYRFVSGAVTQATAEAAANAALLNGVAGHLVNITSAAENSWLDTITGGSNFWIGATDESVEGRWEWESGAEAGANFYNGVSGSGSAVGSYFTSWGGGEPNDYVSGEDYAQFRNGGTWNDYGLPYNNSSLAYVIEWNAEEIQVDTSANTLNGGTGNDQIYGDGGIDTIHGDADNDILYGLGGNDLLYGDAGSDVLHGGAGNDMLDGGTGYDYLYGGAGNDTLYGRTGNDVMEGGAGADILRGGDQTEISFSSGMFHSYAGSQDVSSTINIMNNNVGFSITGNAWKAVDFSYSVTANTVLEFDYKSTVQPEISGIGFDTDLNFGNDSNRFFMFGTQTTGISWAAATNTFEYDGSGNWVHVQINVGNYFTGNFSQMTFINDDDSGPTGNSFYRNVVVHENDGGNNTLNGGEGIDDLYGSSGADSFVFDSSAFVAADRIHYFTAQDGDTLDISDIISGWSGSSNITDYLRFTNSGDHALVQVDANGASGGANFVTVGNIWGGADLDASTLYTNGNIITT